MRIDLRDEQDAIERGEREVRRKLALDVVDADGEVIAESGQNLTDTIIRKIRKADITKVSVFVASGRAESTLIKNTLAKDPTARISKKGEEMSFAVNSKQGEELA